MWSASTMLLSKRLKWIKSLTIDADMIPCDLLFVLMNWIKTTITLNNVKFLLMTVEDSGRFLICKSA